MFHYLRNFLPLLVSLVLAACAVQTTQQLPQDWIGTWRTTLPCADCAGIETALTLKSDRSYELSNTYIDHPPAFVTTGKFDWNKENNSILLRDADGQRYQLEAGKLYLLGRDGKRVTGALAQHYILTREAVSDSNTTMKSSITEQRWLLVELMGEPIPSGEQQPYIFLEAENQHMHGFGGCNRLSGGYQLTAPDRVQFPQVAATMMACAQGMQLEQRFFKALENSDSYTLTSSTLVLKRAAEPLARFVAGPAEE